MANTTMLNCLAAAIPGGDRVVSAEEVFELKFAHPERGKGRCRMSGFSAHLYDDRRIAAA